MIRVLSFIVLPLLSWLFFLTQSHAVENKWAALFISFTKAEGVGTLVLAPTSFLLLGAGLAGLVYLARRRGKE